MKTKGIGWTFLLLSGLLALAAAAAYMYNTGTAYFSAMGRSSVLCACLLAGGVLPLLALLLSRRGWKAGMDLLPALTSGAQAAALVLFLGARINETAFILTFQRTAANLADLNSALAGMGLCFLALITSWIAAFCRIKE